MSSSLKERPASSPCSAQARASSMAKTLARAATTWKARSSWSRTSRQWPRAAETGTSSAPRA
ncbi:hypothetical protein ACFQVA_01775 [Actinomadura keratinilytica]